MLTTQSSVYIGIAVVLGAIVYWNWDTITTGIGGKETKDEEPKRDRKKKTKRETKYVDMSGSWIILNQERVFTSKMENESITGMWQEPDISTSVQVRGMRYLDDRLKVPAGPPMFRLLHVDLFQTSTRWDHIARHERVQALLEEARTKLNTVDSTVLVLNFQIPGDPALSCVVYWAMMDCHSPTLRAHNSKVHILWEKFVQGDDAFRNNRFKLIPHMPEGSWALRNLVGSRPVLLGKKVQLKYFQGDGYFEIDVDVASSIVADQIELPEHYVFRDPGNALRQCDGSLRTEREERSNFARLMSRN